MVVFDSYLSFLLTALLSLLRTACEVLEGTVQLQTTCMSSSWKSSSFVHVYYVVVHAVIAADAAAAVDCLW